MLYSLVTEKVSLNKLPTINQEKLQKIISQGTRLGWKLNPASQIWSSSANHSAAVFDDINELT
jgi:hypothetical protein